MGKKECEITCRNCIFYEPPDNCPAYFCYFINKQIISGVGICKNFMEKYQGFMILRDVVAEKRYFKKYSL